MTYNELINEIKSLKYLPGASFSIIGTSMLNEPIYCVHLGDFEGAQISIDGGIHAREYITSFLVCDLAKYVATKKFKGGIYFIPLVNPDGVRLVLDGINYIICDKTKAYLQLVNNGNLDFSLWKANANAVDLNVNFDALWGEGEKNVKCPSGENFIGFFPNSERETLNMINFANNINPSMVISYHTKGEVIYYGFETLTDKQILRDKKIADVFAGITGYMPIKTTNSVGSYTDWISLNYKVPAFTFEVGSESLTHPISVNFLPEILEQNKEIPLTALKLVNKINFNDQWHILY